MARVARLDYARLSSVQRTPQGGLRAPATLTRVGVLEYRDGAGKTWREYRPREEVFHADALATLRGAPVTDKHPATFVTAETWKQLAVGHVGDDVRADGDFVAATVLVQDAAQVALVQAGDRREVSCGYTCEVEHAPGVTPEGERYDAVQRQIKYNHVGLGPAGWGRAGPEVALRMDGAAVEVRAGGDAATTNVRADAAGEERRMSKKLKVAGREFRVDDEAAVAEAQAAVETVEQSLKSAGDALQKTATDLLGQIAQLQAKLTAMEAEKAAAAPPEVSDEVLDARAAERAAFLAGARRVLGDAPDLEKKPRAEVKRAVLAKAIQSVKLDGLDERVIDGMFNTVVALAATPRNDALAATQAAAVGAGAKPEAREDSLEDAQKALTEKLMRAGREPLNAAQKGA